jgi:hypothetical protein
MEDRFSVFFRKRLPDRTDHKGRILNIEITAVIFQLDQVKTRGILFQIPVKEVHDFFPEHFRSLIIPDALFVDPDVTKGNIVVDVHYVNIL